MPQFTLKLKGQRETYTVPAASEHEALRAVIAQHRIDVRKIEYLKEGETLSEEIVFIAQVGSKDYITSATCEREALTKFAQLGLNMNKLTNLRRK